jgi:hypothetical protein
MVTASCPAVCRLAKQRAHHSSAVPSSLSAPCALKLASQQKPPTKRGTCCAAATDTSDNLNNAAAPRYADNEAHIWIVEHRLRAERLAIDRLTRATKPLVWATGVLVPATIALMLVTLTQLSDGHGGTKRSRQPTRWVPCLSLAPSETY